jgi:hypothetical protein
MIHKESDPYPDVTIADGEFYKDGFFYMMKGAGNGDVILNTCSEIVDNKDKSEWAKKSILECATLLMDRKRWPDRMIWEGREAKGWIRYYWSKMWKYVGVIDHHLRRPQKDVTRDPYVVFYCACEFLDMSYLIELVTIPVRLRRGGIQRRRKKLIRDRREKWRNRLDYYASLADVLNFRSLYPEDHENW